MTWPDVANRCAPKQLVPHLPGSFFFRPRAQWKETGRFRLSFQPLELPSPALADVNRPRKGERKEAFPRPHQFLIPNIFYGTLPIVDEICECIYWKLRLCDLLVGKLNPDSKMKDQSNRTCAVSSCKREPRSRDSSILLPLLTVEGRNWQFLQLDLLALLRQCKEREDEDPPEQYRKC
ncbi:hypothetical protein H8959_017410 [Pygathrix nigripes]